jgi:hypothetical protein
MLAGQFVAMVLANSPIMAEQAAALVKVEYTAADPQHSYSHVDRRTASDSDKIVPSTDSSKALARNAGGASTVSGSIAHCQQKHFYMETQTTLAIPSEDGAFGHLPQRAWLAGRAEATCSICYGREVDVVDGLASASASTVSEPPLPVHLPCPPRASSSASASLHKPASSSAVSSCTWQRYFSGYSASRAEAVLDQPQCSRRSVTSASPQPRALPGIANAHKPHYDLQQPARRRFWRQELSSRANGR